MPALYDALKSALESPYTRPIASPEFQNDEALKKNCRGERSLVLVTLSNAPLNPVI